MPPHWRDDPWTSVRTKHDLRADEVISALQKEIRRGNVENAVALAYEMIATSAELETKLWQRLVVISVEDVGWGEINAPILVGELQRMTTLFRRDEGDRILFALHAVRYLCRCTKDRSTDEMANWIIGEMDSGRLVPTIADYALDMHTARGQDMQRDIDHFYAEAAQVAPELAGRDTIYLTRILSRLDDER